MEEVQRIYLQKIGTNIRKLRESKNLSQFDLAVDCNIPKMQISKIEQAEINTTIWTLKKIAVAFEVSVSELFIFDK